MIGLALDLKSRARVVYAEKKTSQMNRDATFTLDAREVKANP